MAWAYEGNEGYVPAKKMAHHTPLYRLWKEPHHAYTTSKKEYDRMGRRGHSKEGVAAYVAKKRVAGHTALHWLSHPKTGDTVFTCDTSERDRLKRRRGYDHVGVVGYVAKEMHEGHQPFYRAFDPTRKDHLYSFKVATIDENGPTLTRAELDAMIRRALRACLWPRIYRIELADELYYCPSLRVARGIAREAKVDRRRYMEEIFDCDDFAHLLKGAFIEDVYDSGKRSVPYAMGILWGNTPAHAMNFAVVSDGRDFALKVIEPQKSSFYEPKMKILKDIYLVVA